VIVTAGSVTTPAVVRRHCKGLAKGWRGGIDGDFVNAYMVRWRSYRVV
jgi:hypothetical protein